MNTWTFAKYAIGTTAAAAILAGCSGAAGLNSPATIPNGQSAMPFGLHVSTSRTVKRAIRPDTCPGNALYFSDYQNSVIDSFGATGGSSACTITPGGLANPMGIWVQPVAGSYHNDLFAANFGNGTAVAYKTPLRSTSVPMWQFNAGGAPSDAVQDMFGNVYVAQYGQPKIMVFTPPFSACAYPTGCSPSYAISDPCGSAYWLATDGKGDVYDDNACGYVTLFVTPITPGQVGTKLVGTSYTSAGGMIVDRHNRLIVNDQVGTITSYTMNVLFSTATPAFTLAPYTGQIFGIGLDKTDKFLWGANESFTQGQRYSYASGGTGGTPTATDPTLIVPLGAAVRPASPE